ncbi:DUF4825 domain-containing protein [Sporosarcina sp. P12(2017)]|uniref:DUF4825 domain-containing protein n=1 Tax=unclassified Sporosarcina TaxID=2647733 RepID=UPI000C16D20E|nr:MULTISPECIES: DUF4825 domain-containing protein [unclassified Sporosarcina]PIC56478.1 DUF4825 domain-containing protein [Sporosarcina sp. P10]PIC59775.1 DUF4825 domain-containing protein [Sporosarcina sp. P12(2017)]
MKKFTKYFLFSFILVLFLSGCSSTNELPNEGLFEYKESFIGDNSAVVHIIEQLRYAEQFEKVSLETKTEPYGMTIQYEHLDTSMEESGYKEAAVYNASYLFTLIDNAEWVAFDFGGNTYKVNKSKLEDWYGKELNDFTNEEELDVFIQEKLKDESEIQQLFVE